MRRGTIYGFRSTIFTNKVRLRHAGALIIENDKRISKKNPDIIGEIWYAYYNIIPTFPLYWKSLFYYPDIDSSR